jgi:two-component system sensor histidine kinase CpxA
MKVRLPLYVKILAWFCVNFLVIGALLLAVFNLQVRFAPDSSMFGIAANRFEATAQSVAFELNRAPCADWDAILRRHSETWNADFVLVSGAGERLAGSDIAVPSEGRRLAMQRWRPAAEREGGRPPVPPPGGRFGPPHAPFSFRTESPRFYWQGSRIGLFPPNVREPQPGVILVRSASMFGNGLFFDPRPWAAVAFAVFGLSALMWLPFARGLARSVRQLTEATTRIADERFDVRVDERRSDELGVLGKAINRLAIRISGFIGGQKRFLGDVAHELNSPLGRLQMTLGILERDCPPELHARVADAQEEVQVMSSLINELLAFSKAGIRAAETRRESVELSELTERVVAREAGGDVDVRIAVPPGLAAVAHGDLLARALANLIRNAMQYAGSAGPIVVSGERRGDAVRIAVSDSGSGVPESEAEKLFDPFYRLESDRSRTTGGSGLGLAIVKSCVEACGGEVGARNLKPHGFEVAITLPAAPPSA